MSDAAATGRRYYIPLLSDKQIIHYAETMNVIAPFEREYLSGSAYDLRAGRVLRSRNRERRFDLGSGAYSIETFECVALESLEEINFRHTRLYGLLVNKHSLLAKGVFHPATVIDPGFSGPLALTFFNLGSTAEEIAYGQRVAKLMLFELRTDPERIYGITQVPSYRPGTTEIATIMDKIPAPSDDISLKAMMGAPVKRIFERIENVERALETKNLRYEVDKVRRRRAAIFAIILALLSGLSGAVATAYWPAIVGSVAGWLP